MIGASIIITPELVVAVGKLAAEHPDASVEIAYDDVRAEQLWSVTFADYSVNGEDTAVVYLVNDETGVAVNMTNARLGDQIDARRSA